MLTSRLCPFKRESNIKKAQGLWTSFPKEKHVRIWCTTHLKSLITQCCLQIGSWYSSSSNMIGLQFVEEPSWDWEEPKGLCLGWLLAKRQTSRPFPWSRTATVSVNLYKSETFNLCPNLKGRRFKIYFSQVPVGVGTRVGEGEGQTVPYSCTEIQYATELPGNQ